VEWRQALEVEENGAGVPVAAAPNRGHGQKHRSVPESAALTINEGAVYDAHERGLANPAAWALSHRAADDTKPAEADRFPGATPREYKRLIPLTGGVRK
jgi:hypothetical protein